MGNMKLMIAMYRYRISVAKGGDPAESLVRAIESVTETFYEYAELYKLCAAAV